MRTIQTLLAALILAAVSGLPAVAEADAPDPQCWGQASAVFAQTGAMGEHASEQPTPRLGLRNLARALFESGVLGSDSLAALGAFVAAELALDVAACR